jgi:hypothetical protein
MQSIARVFARSPSVAQMLAYNCSALIASVLTQLIWLGASFADVVKTFFVGLVVHGFLEYWFHRYFLHNVVWEVAHSNHHRFQTRLKIICTPMVPVVLYAFAFSLGIAPWVGLDSAVGVLSGLAVGQLLMDGVHVVEHSRWRPNWLEVSRLWHAWHHGCDDTHATSTCHGLTCFFWDSFFGTWPEDWPLHKRFPYLRWLVLPLPLISSFMMMPFLHIYRKELAERENQSKLNVIKASLEDNRVDAFSMRVAASTTCLELLYPIMLGSILPGAITLAASKLGLPVIAK